MPRYEPQHVEPKWQQYWETHATFVTPNEPPAGSKGKKYILDMFPYPSGSGLHVGHPEGYTATDIVCRYSRMNGWHVLHPMGWDAFGLPAEQHAINTGTHPRVTTYENIDNFRRQLKMLGFSYDWSREISTTDEDYYRWTQWIFLQLYDTWYDPACTWTDAAGRERQGKGRPIAELPIPDAIAAQGTAAVRAYQDEQRLAYQSEAPVNWCPELGTVLANEEVTAEGLSDRGGFPVERRALRQWMLRITAYAERLLSELDEVDWPESVKILQRNWIGKSVGAEVDFFVATEAGSTFEDWQAARKSSGLPSTPEVNVIRVYTTRPDTLFGATYMVLAPEHPLVDAITTEAQRAAVEEYRRKSSLKSDLDRTDLAKEKSGIFTGAFAINPINGEQLPIWIADYVLISYGTGAIMAVPAHDERDFEFAQTYGLDVRCVIDPGQEVPFFSVGQKTSNSSAQAKNQSKGAIRDDILAGKKVYVSSYGTAINSDRYTGTPTVEFKRQITSDLTAAGLGREAVNFRLRDWLFSRQRYWGEPFPIWHELDAEGNPTGRVRPVAEAELPVTLPDMDDFKPKGTPDPPLSWAPESWLYTTAEDGTRLKRETNSMPQWAGSCWYYLRFADNKNGSQFIDPETERYWLPVDLYIGGAEHAVLHLLYSRFWHKVLFDRGHVSTAEPFQKLVNQGMILGEQEHSVFFDSTSKTFFSPKNVERRDFEGNKFCFVANDKIISLATFSDQNVIVKGDVAEFWNNTNDWTSDNIKDGEKIGECPLSWLDSRSYKMSKSRGNVINPDDVVQEYGADSLRLYEMFMGPLEQVKPWSMKGVEGVYRFLGRVWRLIVDDAADEVALSSAVQQVPLDAEQERVLHKTIKGVTEDIEKLSFNTAISKMMEFTNYFTGKEVRPQAALEPLVLLLAPFAPHIAEELWQVLGHADSLACAPWPAFDESKIVEAEIEVPVQVNGKVRGKVRVPADADAATMQQLAENDPAVTAQLAGKTVVKVVCVPKRMVNFVVKG